MERQVISVTELNLYIKNKLDSDPLLSGLLVRGEISNFKRYSSGHCYFTLKDIGGAVRAVMFNSSAQRLKFAPTDGMKVIASGRVSLYERDGQYQLYVTSLEPDGLGTLHLAYEQLKARLSEEGLFDDELKREIPKYPRRIGVITSPTGAAVRDIINITKRRFPLAEICVYPAVVQGDEAVPTLIAGLEYFGKTDTICTFAPAIKRFVCDFKPSANLLERALQTAKFFEFYLINFFSGSTHLFCHSLISSAYIIP